MWCFYCNWTKTLIILYTKSGYLFLAKETPRNWTKTWSSGWRREKTSGKWEARTVWGETCQTDRTEASGAESWACAAGEPCFVSPKLDDPSWLQTADLFTFPLARRMEWA